MHAKPMIPRASRGRALVAVVSFLAALLLAAPGSEPAVAADKPPNIVVVMTDDQDARSMWAMPKTQDALAGRGITFRNSFVTYSLCCPSRATFLTGQYAHNHGVRSNDYPDGGLLAFHASEPRALPVALERAGYRTAFVGKYLNRYPERVREDPRWKPPGWSRWFAISQAGMFDWELNDNGTLRRFGNRARHYNTDVLARIAKRFVRNSANRTQPFFLSVLTLAPHGERELGPRAVNPRPAPRHAERFPRLEIPRVPSFDRSAADKPKFLQRPRPMNQAKRDRLRAKHQGRMRSLLAVDDLVAGLVDELRATGELENTYVVFTSDNGFMLGEHRLTQKSFLYEESIRVPLIIRGPELARGQTRDEPVANIDLAPTILDLAGARPLIEPDGVSLRDVIAAPDAFADRDILLQKLNDSRQGSIGEGIRSPGFTYIRQEVEGETYHELYDLRPDSAGYDPFQLTNRYGDPSVAVEQRRLEARLRALRACRGTRMPRPCGPTASGSLRRAAPELVPLLRAGQGRASSR
ncbi:MAG TPA: sulfatase [Solirubrobacterales bacterium]|nr:sulfatase [Solirubrobacterales bacterium]